MIRTHHDALEEEQEDEAQPFGAQDAEGKVQLQLQRKRRPSIVPIPRSEGNAFGLAPPPSDRELVAFTIALHSRKSAASRSGAADAVGTAAGHRASSVPMRRPRPMSPPSQALW